MLPQPPINAETSPPFEAAPLSRRKWKWLWVVGIIAFIIALAGLTAPMTIKCRKKSDQTEAVNNARQIGMALFEFETEYGKFPDATTIAAVRQNTGSLVSLGTKSSNDFFRQLVASNITQSEAMFYAKCLDVRKPDGLIDGSHAIAKHECGFTYFLGADIKDNPNRPIVVTPMIPGTDRFDPKIHEGKAVILKMNNSVMSYNINKDGRVLIDGRNVMDPAHPIWDGHPPVIAWPEF